MTIPKASQRWQPGTWMKWVFGPGNVSGAVVTCPNGHGMSVGGAPFGSRHTIGSDGTVSPSVVCPRSGCGWHVMLRLAGW